MPYFIIIPAYGLLLIVLMIAAVATRAIGTWKPATGYIIGGTIGSLIGFTIANILVTALGLLPSLATGDAPVPDWLRQVCALITIITLIIGPFLASAAGILIGFAAGTGYVLRRRRSHATQTVS